MAPTRCANIKASNEVSPSSRTMHNGSPTTMTRRSIRQDLEEWASARGGLARLSAGFSPVLICLRISERRNYNLSNEQFGSVFLSVLTRTGPQGWGSYLGSSLILKLIDISWEVSHGDIFHNARRDSYVWYLFLVIHLFLVLVTHY
jgi:hypothetical protein